MNTLTELSNPPSSDTPEVNSAPFFVRGKVVEGNDQTHRSRDLGVTFVTPKPDLNALVQRCVRLGEAGPSAIGNPHDAMYPLHRFVHWMANEDGCEAQ